MNSIEQQIWGFTSEGEAIILYTMTNDQGASVELTNIGAGIVSIRVPDREGVLGDVCLGYPDPKSYFHDGPCMGKTPGRFANRIGEGRFSIDGTAYQLAQNAAGHHLHGGPNGFQNKLWSSRVETDRVVFALVSPDGDENYPGEVTAEVCYDWDDACNLEITFYAKSSAPTIINLTNHAYFNMRGEATGAGSLMEQELQLNAQSFLWYDNGCIPTGEFTPVADTPMDFRTPKPIGQDIGADYEPLNIGHGYDQCWVIDGYQKGELSEVGSLYDPTSGRVMEIRSTQPGVQIYTGNFLAGCPTAKGDRRYENRAGVAIECQALPDSPNKANFPSAVLRPEELYCETIQFHFGVR